MSTKYFCGYDCREAELLLWESFELGKLSKAVSITLMGSWGPVSVLSVGLSRVELY